MHTPTRARAGLATCALPVLAALGLAAAPAARAQQTLYAASYGSNTITKFTPGGVASTFATTGLNQSTGLAFAPAATPEPSQAAALSLGVPGLAGLALKARRRRA